MTQNNPFPAGHALHTDSKDPLKDDFRAFLWLCWQHLGLPEPTFVQYDMARFMQKGPRRKMIMAFRGVGKTYIYGAFACWRLYCDPNWKIIIVSGAQKHADNISKFVKALISEMPVLNHLKPREGQRDTNIEFDVGPARTSKDPSVKSVGITGQITGSRADEALMDDIETLNNSATAGARERLSEVVKEVGGAVVKPGGYISYLGTPQTAMSMYRELPDRGYTIRIWPAEVPKDPSIYNGMLAPMVQRMIQKGVPAGTPVDPKRFNEFDLEERRAEYKQAGYSLQFMLDTSGQDANRYPLKLSDLMVMPLDRKMAPNKIVWGREEAVEECHVAGLPGDRYYKPIFRSKEMSPYNAVHTIVDPSGRGEDETSCITIGELNGNLYLLDLWGTRDGYGDETLHRIAMTAYTFNSNKIIVESNFGDGMFVKLLEPHLRNLEVPRGGRKVKVRVSAAVEEVRASVQKELRIIDTIEPVMTQHRLIVHEDLINRDFESAGESVSYALFYQMTRLTRDRGSLPHDDRLDALAWGVASFADVLMQDQDEAAALAEQDAWDREEEEWMRDATGREDASFYGDNFVHERGTIDGWR